jgi:hypothetical protein
VTDGSSGAENADKNSGGINESEDEDRESASAETAALVFGRLRRRSAFAPQALVLAFFFGGT